MKVLGITGGIGAGKSSVLAILEQEYDAFIIRADDIARQLQEPGQPGYLGLMGLFGEAILDSDKKISRNRLADLIFNDEARLAQVNGIIHPLTWERIRELIRSRQAELTAVESALFSRETSGFCDEIWFIDVADETRIKRLMESRGYTREKARRIMQNQPDRETFLALADQVIANNKTAADVRRQIKQLLQTEGKKI